MVLKYFQIGNTPKWRQGYQTYYNVLVNNIMKEKGDIILSAIYEKDTSSNYSSLLSRNTWKRLPKTIKGGKKSKRNRITKSKKKQKVISLLAVLLKLEIME